MCGLREMRDESSGICCNGGSETRPVPLGKVRVEEARLDVADVQLARRLGREARHHLAVDGVGQVDLHVAGVLLRAEEALRDRDAAQGERYG